MEITRQLSGTAHLGDAKEPEDDEDVEEEEEEGVELDVSGGEGSGLETQLQSPKKKKGKTGEGPRFCEQRTVINQLQFGEVSLLEFGGIDCRGATLLEGFQDESQAAYLAASLITDQLKLPLIGEIVSTHFPVVCYVKQHSPCGGCRIYGNAQIVTVVSEFKLLGEVGHAVIDAILDFAQRWELTTIICVEGVKKKLELPRHVPPPRTEQELMALIADRMSQPQGKPESIKFFSSSETLSTQLVNAGCVAIGDALIGGLSGGLVHRAPTTPHSAVICLFANYNPIIPDGAAAMQIIKLVSDEFLPGEIIDVSELSESAKKMQSKLQEAISDISANQGASSGAAMGMYT